jgi:cell wall-associated NlpC family hydrolase
MPNRFRSLLLALVLAASVSACLTASAGGDLSDVRARHPRPMLGPVQVHANRHLRRQKPTLGERAARIALGAVGVPYRWGGSSPAGGFDCSGLVYWTYGKLGIELPHSSYALAGEGRRIGRSHLKPGDLLFFTGYGHVGLYLGKGRMVHAPHAGRRVEIVRLARSSYGRALDTARRVR